MIDTRNLRKTLDLRKEICIVTDMNDDKTINQAQTAGVDAVAAGSLPVSSAEAIIHKWSEHRNFAAHQQQRAPMGTLERRAWKERRNLIEEMLNDMGRLAGLPIPRQPEENTKFRDAGGQSPALRTDDQPHSL